MGEVVTGEAVVLDLPVARFPTRMLAHLIDMAVQVPVLIGIVVLVVWGVASHSLNTASAAAVLVAGLVLVIVGYPAAVETLSRGRTLGKLALGLRVVADDGGPVRFRQALVRALAGAIECWSLVGVPALITSMLSPRGQRLGDIFAGTIAVLERTARPPAASYPAAAPYPGAAYPGAPSAGAGGPAQVPASFVEPALRPWAATLDLSGIPEPLIASVASYLSRYWQLEYAARERLGWQLIGEITARVPPPPPGLPPVACLYAVLAERRGRDLARLQAAPPAGFAAPAQAPAPAGQPVPPAQPTPPGQPVPPAQPAPSPVPPLPDGGEFVPPT